MEAYKERFIDFLLESGVLLFGDFTTKSGRKTPYFLNAGNFKTGAQIAKLGDFYAENIAASGESFDKLFGPAYKGIPLVTAAAASLWKNYGRDVPYSFNRKEAKDHGEGGSIVGAAPVSGDRVAVVEDVVTAGTAVRETLALMKSLGDIKVTALFVMVDRMERGTGRKSTLRELSEDLDISVRPIVTVREIIARLSETGALSPERKKAMEGYLAEYGGE
ncbi:MAG: orotate phosphoribosyltransferase [Oscillospiraceae bacterium]|nr:orotate phosphoribosyltransferase [Oscillospiraceae bacterium]